MTRNEILAYLAGIIDGEAYVGIKKSRPYKHLTGRINPGYHERIQVRMVAEPCIKLLAKTLGGWYYEEKPHASKGRPLYCYQVSDLRAYQIAKILLPWLCLKRKQALLLIALRKNKNRDKRVAHRVTMRSRWGMEIQVRRGQHSAATVAYRERLYLRCKALNKVGV